MVTKKEHWELTPHPARNCWRKKYRGQQYYVGKGTVRYSEADYRRAQDEWKALQKTLDEQDKADARSEAQTRALFAALNDQPITVDTLLQMGMEMKPDEVAIRRKAEAMPGTLSLEELALLAKRHAARHSPAAEKAPPQTLRTLADQFLARKATQARQGTRSGGRYATLRSYTLQFVEFVGPETDPNKFAAAGELSRWFDELSGDLEEGELSSTTAGDKLQAAKQFVRWLWEANWIGDLPRNIDSKDMVFSRVVGNVEPMPVEVLRRRVKAASGRMQLELLLMANCGFYQKDCADLKHTEVDWKRGTVTRKRSKTKNKEGVPTVTWYLWQSTLDLLREHASEAGETVLPNRNGVAAVRSTVNEDGTVARTDNARTSYDRLEKSLAKSYEAEIEKMNPEEVKARTEAGELEIGEDGKAHMRCWSLKHIRKTTASIIGNHQSFSRYAQYFLGQAPETVADAHYVKPSEDQFRECLQWVGELLALDTVEKIGK